MARAENLLKNGTVAHIKQDRSEKSIVIHHVLDSGHYVNIISLKFVGHVKDRRFLYVHVNLEDNKGYFDD